MQYNFGYHTTAWTEIPLGAYREGWQNQGDCLIGKHNKMKKKSKLVKKFLSNGVAYSHELPKSGEDMI